MACHPDLVLRSKTNATTFIQDISDDTTVCRICNEVAEDAIQAKCRHIFDRECIKQYLEVAGEEETVMLVTITSFLASHFCVARLPCLSSASDNRFGGSSNGT